jgi:hypothetical protein
MASGCYLLRGRTPKRSRKALSIRRVKRGFITYLSYFSAFWRGIEVLCAAMLTIATFRKGVRYSHGVGRKTRATIERRIESYMLDLVRQ